MPRLWRQPWSAIQPNSAQGPKDRWTQGSWAAGPPASSALTPAAAPRSTEGDAQQGSVEAKPLAVAPTPAAAKGVIADSGDSYKALIKVASLLGVAGLLLLAKARLGMWRGGWQGPAPAAAGGMSGGAAGSQHYLHPEDGILYLHTRYTHDALARYTLCTSNR